MSISASLVKELREKTGAGFMDCKEALKECEGDAEKAVDYLRKKGLSAAAKRAGRQDSEGVVGSYIHMGGKIGVLIEINAEKGDVLSNADVKELADDISMHIAAMSPACIAKEDFPKDKLEIERGVFKAQVLEMGKPENIADKIVEGKVGKYVAENTLLEQPFVKNSDLKVKEFLKQTGDKVGSALKIGRFVRFELGEGIEKKQENFAEEVAKQMNQ